jgi:hypothetical protein
MLKLVLARLSSCCTANRQFELTERQQNLLPLPNLPQCHRLRPPWALSYLFAAASYRAVSTPPLVWLSAWPLSIRVSHAIKGVVKLVRVEGYH